MLKCVLNSAQGQSLQCHRLTQECSCSESYYNPHTHNTHTNMHIRICILSNIHIHTNTYSTHTFALQQSHIYTHVCILSNTHTHTRMHYSKRTHTPHTCTHTASYLYFILSFLLVCMYNVNVCVCLWAELNYALVSDSLFCGGPVVICPDL